MEQAKIRKFNEKRKEIVELAKKYLDNSGTIDMVRFRKEQLSAYSRLSYYFNGVNGLMSEVSGQIDKQDIGENIIKNKKEDEVNEIKRATGRGCPISGQSVRNELAYDMLTLMRKNLTFQEIGDIYGVSRAHMHQLVHILERNIVTKERKVNAEMLM